MGVDRGQFPRPHRWHRLRIQTVVAVALGAAVLAGEAGAGRVPAMVRHDAAWVLGPAWSREAAVKQAEAGLERFVAARSWGAVVALMTAASSSSAAAWIPPVAGETVLQPFGWQRLTGDRWAFSSAEVLAVPAGAPVRAPAQGLLARVGPTTLRISVGDTAIVFHGLSPSGRAGAVRAGQVVGWTTGRRLQVTAWRSGIPVNPALPSLYGAALGRP
jgi:murein DD-endopeptidase MepM/ murein hydrolase activator NlpD